MKGFIQVYTGNGKGKTTAAIGLSIRAVGAGKKVFFAQFIKGKPYSEIKVLQESLPAITLKQYGLGCFIEKEPTKADIESAQKGLQEIKKIIQTDSYDLIVLDEANIALFFNLFSVTELIEIVQSKPPETEIIITGRYAPEEIIAIADLVTEMKEVKHYYNSGIEARKGIEY
ncbi:MAG: cob(I)yrinic acid a,c-diamide adenosyltransferase [Bacteroidetes bacterium]|jgi:cob(I)alamin adenosyltransferase|nr:cob(I)yrinic acid a,c-diamide adenosyltransferase [Bacteroidota bacterium]